MHTPWASATVTSSRCVAACLIPTTHLHVWHLLDMVGMSWCSDTVRWGCVVVWCTQRFKCWRRWRPDWLPSCVQQSNNLPVCLPACPPDRLPACLPALQENFMLSDSSDRARVKACDFGLSQFFSPDRNFHSLVGSAFYVAPGVCVCAREGFSAARCRCKMQHISIHLHPVSILST